MAVMVFEGETEESDWQSAGGANDVAGGGKGFKEVCSICGATTGAKFPTDPRFSCSQLKNFMEPPTESALEE